MKGSGTNDNQSITPPLDKHSGAYNKQAGQMQQGSKTGAQGQQLRKKEGKKSYSKWDMRMTIRGRMASPAREGLRGITP